MTRLNPRDVRWIVVHTAAHNGDASVADIRRWHVEGNGWSDIGYHFVIRKNGTLETGRDLRYVGSHVLGINGRSIGICCSGHGDRVPFTEQQIATLIPLVKRLCQEYGVAPANFIGHREVNDLVAAGLVPAQYRTTKTCPGTKVDMDDLRARLRIAMLPLPPKIDPPPVPPLPSTREV